LDELRRQRFAFFEALLLEGSGEGLEDVEDEFEVCGRCCCHFEFLEEVQ
jgi:hypothetical protein